jgi:hypothetical protein
MRSRTKLKLVVYAHLPHSAGVRARDAPTGVSICTRNGIMTGLKFLLRATLRRLDLAAEVYHQVRGTAGTTYGEGEQSSSQQLRDVQHSDRR